MRRAGERDLGPGQPVAIRRAAFDERQRLKRLDRRAREYRRVAVAEREDHRARRRRKRRPRRDGGFQPARRARLRQGPDRAPQPRPTNGILVAMIVIVRILADSGRLGHMDDGVADLARVDRRLDGDPAVGLRNAQRHLARHIGERIADVDLAAGDVVLSRIERDRFGEAGDGVFGGGIGRRIWSRRMGGDRAVVDDAPALRRLAFHHGNGALRAKEGAGQIDVDNRFPLLVGEILHRDRPARRRRHC